MHEQEWWRRGVLYNAYPRSWRDSSGDGNGDLPGVIERLDHLEWLGVDGLWLNPITPSPNRDWGYDVSEYCDVHPDFGRLDDLDRLVAEAARRQIAIVLDMVPCHTSDEHRWFVEARRSRSSRYRDYYVWSPGRADGSPPNNWLSYFGCPAWTRDEASGDYYLHNFSSHQPQLNWWNPQVVEEFDRILRWWFDRGVAGMRIDALQALHYDRLLRDNPPADAGATGKERSLGQRFTFNSNRPEVHDVIRRWRAIAESYERPRLLFGETWVPSIGQLATYYGDGTDELHLAWNVPFLSAPLKARELRSVVEETLGCLPAGAVPAWAMSTHDGEGRASTRWCGGNVQAVRCSILLLLGLPGTPILYYGDEIGMPEPPRAVLAGMTRDSVETDGRDASRTPMHWANEPGAGFTSASSSWLPVGDTGINVFDQRQDPGSTLRLCRDLIQLRRRLPALSSGTITFVPAPRGVLAWRLDGEVTVALNLGCEPSRVPADGVIAVGTHRDRDGERVAGDLPLGPWEGVVVSTSGAFQE